EQSFREKMDTYYQVAYTNTSKANAKYYLFISSGKLDEFRKLDTANGAGGDILFNGMNRFLVYHQSDRVVMKQVCDP
ncbi:hypothetical protein COCVIDRAFT_115063, partial [Bipolaris victoriae FI3]